MINETIKDVITNGAGVYCLITNPVVKIKVLVKLDDRYYCDRKWIVYEHPKEHTLTIMDNKEFERDYKPYEEKDVDMFKQLVDRIKQYLENEKIDIPNFDRRTYSIYAKAIIKDIFNSKGVFIEYYGCRDDPYGMGKNEHHKLLDYLKAEEDSEDGSFLYSKHYSKNGISKGLYKIFKQWTSEIIKLDVLKQFHYLEKCL